MADKERRLASLLGIYLRGMAMGAADLVPGVSGGTIAFITGIYARLLAAISSASRAAPLLLRGQFSMLWRQVDGGFLLTLLGGIATSIVLLSRLVMWLLEAHPVIVWSFFGGLILASSLHLLRQVGRWRWHTGGLVLVGVALAAVIALLKPVEVEPTMPVLFLAGAIAICAMILPGVSGSFLLVLMGLYGPVLAAIRDLELATLAVFASGCMVGILSFARGLSWLLQRHYDRAMALLTGFLLGSLTLVWPWKVTTEWYVGRHGETLPLSRFNAWPTTYEALTGLDPHTAMATAAAVAGVLLVWALERHGNRVAQAAVAD